MPKEVVYPLNFLMGGGGDVPQPQPMTAKTRRENAAAAAAQLSLLDSTKRSKKDAANPMVEQMVLTPAIHHLLNHQPENASDDIDMLPPLIISNVSSAQNAASGSTDCSADAIDSVAKNSTESDIQSKFDDVVSRLQITAQQKSDSNAMMSQLNAQIFGLQTIKIENVLPGGD